MKSLSFAPRSAADIDAIWDYSAATWGADQADRYTDENRDTCRALASGRKLGRSATVRPGYRSCNCGSHIIYYRDLPDRVEVMRILHSAQDVERHLHD